MKKKDQIRLEYEAGAKYKDLAAKYGISANTIKSWRSREKWVRKKNATIQKREGAGVAPEFDVGPIEDYELTDKQKAFCDAYLRSFNATQSYINAFDSTYATASTQGSRLLRKPKIKKYLRMARDQRSIEAGIQTSQLLAKVAAIAFSDFGDYVAFKSTEHGVYDEDGNAVIDLDTGRQKTFIKDEIHLKPQDKVDTSLIKSLSVSPRDGVKLELQDQTKALEWLLNYFTLGGREKINLNLDRLKESVRSLKTKTDQMTGNTADQTYKVDEYLSLLTEALSTENGSEDIAKQDTDP